MKKPLLLAVFFAVICVISVLFTQNVFAQTGHEPEIKVYNSKNLHVDVDFFAYAKTFLGGASVALGDLDGDGKDEIITGARRGGAPQVRVFDKLGKPTGISFYAFDTNFRGGIDVAVGDVDGDKKAEIIVSQASNGPPWVKVYESDGKSIISQFLAFDESFKGGVNIATGDINGDGKDEIIVGAGRGGSPHVRVFNKNGKYLGFELRPFASDFSGGVDVAAANIDSDKKEEIIVSQASKGQAWVKVYKTDRTKYVVSNFLAYSGSFNGGATVSAGDIDNDGAAEIITGTGASGGPQVRAFETSGKPMKVSFFPYSEDYRGGVSVAVGNIDGGVTREIITAPLSKFVEEAKYPYQKYIEVIISEQKLKYFENNEKVDEFLISTGVSGFDTPLGTFSVFSKVSAARMTGFYGPGSPLNYDLPGVPWVMSFLGPYTIHGTYWHNNFGNRMSHGCVNLPTPKAYELYQWADIGTTVIIHN